MQTENRFFDDMARLATGAMGAALSVRQELEARFRAELERIVADMGLATRDEYEAVKAMAAKARQEQEALEKRLAVLERALAETKGASATA
jgi:BMFP domain-containing protein YqiC